MKSALPLLVLFSTASGAGLGMTTCSGACKPWKNKCKAGDKIDLRFAVGAVKTCTTQTASDCGTNNAAGEWGCTSTAENDGCVGYKSHFFCGKVDEFTSVELKDSATYMHDAVPESGNSNYTGYLDLAVFGTGKLTDKDLPEQGMSSRIPVFQAMHDKCNGPALANFLVYNVTFTDGAYKYKNDDPTGNGFMNTCDGDRCEFDSSSVCITDKTKKYNNCAQCLNKTGDAANDIRILITYYGTDSSGDVLLSGSSNPLNFRQFALDNVANSISKDINNINFPSI
eukprot:TRINITY_DN5233_c0_g5_i2.p1 TRINITY_DN5233_c0_g5~~TRINITY_DN5233_c0_g5_i2.p1  ORF type:complete len:283 (+),score=80.09 TRINITY_DN5233_c0_g5_i2:63-911(+)